MAQVVEHLPNKHEALSSYSSMAKKRKEFSKENSLELIKKRADEQKIMSSHRICEHLAQSLDGGKRMEEKPLLMMGN
jgi:alpha-D-ribose 1-methylphosphonate 5-triphosphate diphosphatase PhnM